MRHSRRTVSNATFHCAAGPSSYPRDPHEVGALAKDRLKIRRNYKMLLRFSISEGTYDVKQKTGKRIHTLTATTCSVPKLSAGNHRPALERGLHFPSSWLICLNLEQRMLKRSLDQDRGTVQNEGTQVRKEINHPDVEADRLALGVHPPAKASDQ